MIYKREEYEHWIQDYLQPRYPELVEDFRACLNGFEQINTNNRVDKDSLNSIIYAARSPRIPLSHTATYFLRDLSGYYSEACKAIVEMFDDKHWHVRSNAVLSLGQATPSDIVLVILKKGLQDRSARVRELAAWQAQSLRVLNVIPDLENQLVIEPHTGVKHSIDFHLRLLRDGYFLESSEGAPPFIWVPSSDGINGRFVSQEDIDTKGIQAIISEIRSHPYG
jgi:hypothetical protein